MESIDRDLFGLAEVVSLLANALLEGHCQSEDFEFGDLLHQTCGLYQFE